MQWRINTPRNNKKQKHVDKILKRIFFQQHECNTTTTTKITLNQSPNIFNFHIEFLVCFVNQMENKNFQFSATFILCFHHHHFISCLYNDEDDDDSMTMKGKKMANISLVCV